MCSISIGYFFNTVKLVTLIDDRNSRSHSLRSFGQRVRFNKTYADNSSDDDFASRSFSRRDAGSARTRGAVSCFSSGRQPSRRRADMRLMVINSRSNLSQTPKRQ
jgi:hypothetical protein